MFYNPESARKIYGKKGTQFENISLYDLYFILLECWNENTCAPRLREKFRNIHVTTGQCSITSFLIQDFYGGEVYGVGFPGGGAHCFNAFGNQKIDLTSEQFGDKVLVYDFSLPQEREKHFEDKDKCSRYLLLKEILLNKVSK